MSGASHLAAAVAVTPIVGALASSLVPHKRWLRTAVLLSTVANVGAAALLTWHVATAGPFRYAVGGWDPPLGIAVGADGLSAVWLATVALVLAACTVYADAYLGTGGSNGSVPDRGFWVLWFFMWSGVNSLFVAADLFHVYVCLELSGLTAVSLVAISGGAESWRAALRYLLAALLGSLCFLLGTSFVYAAHGTLDFTLLAARGTFGAIDGTALTLLTGGLVVKVALFPAHFWLPPAHGNAPAPVSAVLSGVVIKTGFYLVLRLWFSLFPGLLATSGPQVLGWLGGAAVLWGGVQACRAPRLKMMIAYSTVAQVGYFFLLFAFVRGVDSAGLAWSGAVYLALSHAFSKAALFLAAGSVLRAVGSDHLAALRGIGLRLPISASAAALAAVSLMGLPPSGGFLGKWLLLNAALRAGSWWGAAVLLGGSLLAAVYLFRFLGPAFAAEPCAVPGAGLVRRRMEFSALGLALAAMTLGLFATYPLGLLSLGAPPLLGAGAP